MSELPDPNLQPKERACCCATDRASHAKKPGTPGRKRRSWLLFSICAVLLLALAFLRPLQRRCTAYFLLQAEGPSEAALADAVEQAADRGALLQRLWLTHKLPHRCFVARYFSRASTNEPALFAKLEPLMLEATTDPDVEVRQLALAALERLKHPQLRRLALEQLPDVDPAVRILGLQSLRRLASSNDVAIAMGLLKDPEPRVAVAAAMVLRDATGQDFGLKSSHALPRFTFIDTNPPAAPDLQAISQGVERWQNWWTIHQPEYPAALPVKPQQRNPVALETPDFSLNDSAGQVIHLQQYRGKVVLLAFWGVDAPANLDMLALKTLQQRYSDGLAVLGICIPAIPSCADEHEHGEEHAEPHHHHGSCPPPSTPDQMRETVQATVRPLQLNYSMLVDPEENIGSRFNVEDRPTYVLLDAQGRIRRRFVGIRTEQALSAMVEAAVTSGAGTPKLSNRDEPGWGTQNRNTERSTTQTTSK